MSNLQSKSCSSAIAWMPNSMTLKPSWATKWPQWHEQVGFPPECKNVSKRFKKRFTGKWFQMFSSSKCNCDLASSPCTPPSNSWAFPDHYAQWPQDSTPATPELLDPQLTQSKAQCSNSLMGSFLPGALTAPSLGWEIWWHDVAWYRLIQYLIRYFIRAIFIIYGVALQANSISNANLSQRQIHHVTTIIIYIYMIVIILLFISELSIFLHIITHHFLNNTKQCVY